MSLINCPECGKKLSSAVKQCIKCGYPIGVIVKNQLIDSIILDATIEQLNFSIRTYRALRQAGIKTVKDIVSLNIDQLMEIRNLGKKSMEEISSRLLELGLRINDECLPSAHSSYKPKATKLDWKCERAPKNMMYSTIMHDFTSVELKLLKAGRVPTDMEEKWFFYYDDGALYFYRSWTGKLIYSIVLNEQTNKHILIRFYDNKEELEGHSDSDIIELINSLINNYDL